MYKATERPRPRKTVAMGVMKGVVAREAVTGVSCWGRMSRMGRLLFFVEGVDWLKWLILFSALTWFVLIASREKHKNYRSYVPIFWRQLNSMG